MRERLLICFLLGYLNCALANISTKSCDDCIKFRSCNAAMDLFRKRDPVANTKLQTQICGHDHEGLPKVCCNALSPEPTPEPTPRSTRFGAETAQGVEGHPNLSLLPNTCGTIEVDRIIGGRVAGIREFPWMVLLSYRTKNGINFNCGGSLINERYVLTAAHCIVNQRLLGVRVGEHDIESDIDCEGKPPNQICESNIRDIRIEETITHPTYNGKPRIRNDIALLRLETPVVFSENALPICLPVTNAMLNRDIRGLNGSVAGWGITEHGFTSSKLLTVNVPVLTQQSCSDLYNRGARVNAEDQTTNKLCAGTTGRDSCSGDSGGPLMFKAQYKNVPGDRQIQHGIVSYGPIYCGSNFPGVYTDVTKYMLWILNTIRP